jgi:hypothetical protein
MSSLYVIDLKGEKEPFSSRKVYESAQRVGASKKLARDIANTIKKEVKPGTKTSEIYKRVKELLSEKEPKPALKFSLKEAMRRLGPTGFPFEKYVGEIFSSRGFKVKLNQRIAGRCCVYEIDFLAIRKDLVLVGECKYRSDPAGKVDSNIALINHARYLDIKEGSSFGERSVQSVLVTNSKFTDKAIRYSNCVGVELLGWRYPREKGLEKLIEEEKMYPVTVLPSLRDDISNTLAKKRMMMAKDLLKIDIRDFSKKTRIPQKVLKKLKNEASILLE